MDASAIIMMVLFLLVIWGGLAISIGLVLFMLGLISEQIALLRYINSDR